MPITETERDDVQTQIPFLLSRMMGLEDRAETTVGRMVIQLTRDLIENRIAAGEQLNSIDLARRFGLSRTPVREALVLLEKEGLIDVPPRRRPRAAWISPQRIAEVYELRAELYGLVARKAAQRISAPDLARLKHILSRMEQSHLLDDWSSYFWYNVLYHEHLASAVGNTTLKRSIDALGVMVLQLRNRNMRPLAHRKRSFADHARLTMAIEDGDDTLAAALSRTLVLAGLSRLKDEFPETGQ
ncbi:GntR family transcriptional regulator [Pararhizobium haloflavum]|uniref:GntR family transcriptional regulator n=1 Tax=Pararhizobium haloflavum TaxID=2037914 RepID=UPI0018E46E55|nr:GntR family transcriptional regulator [Pararhizobium haloflavum]